MDITSFLIGKEVGGGSAPTPTYQDKEITITQNGEQTITADEGYDALSSVEITTNVPQPSGKITITQNGTDIDVSSYASADVSVGGGVSEYFNTLSAGTSQAPSYLSLIKKYPQLEVQADAYNNKKLNYAFYYYNLNTIPENINASEVLNYTYCFGYLNSSTKKIDLTGWSLPNNFNINNKTFNMEAMFFYASKIEEVDMSNLGKVITISGVFTNMFQQCTSLKKIDLSNFVIEVPSGQTSFTQTNNMFYGCTHLEELDMSNFDFTVIYTYTGMFGEGSGQSWDFPVNCLIYVKDQTQKDWLESHFSFLTNVQIKGA